MLYVKKQKDSEKVDWASELMGVQREIENARSRFNMATEEELIEQCVYELNALQSRYTYFLRKVREEGVTSIGSPVREVKA